MQMPELIEKYSGSFITPPSLSSDRQRLLFEVIQTVHDIKDHAAAETNLIVFIHDEDQYQVLESVVAWLYQAQQQNQRNLRIPQAIEILIGFYKEAAALS